jgi:putative zinc finger/helix-turn-helix YgiT family protein
MGDFVCLCCDSQTFRLEETQLTVEIRGEQVEIKARAFVCAECGDAQMSPGQMSEAQVIASDEYRARHDLLTGNEIRRRRKTLHMSQDRFAEYVHVSSASIKRWERSGIQDESADKLIRVLTDPKESTEAHNELLRRLLG